MSLISAQAEGLPLPKKADEALRLWSRLACCTGEAGFVQFLHSHLVAAVSSGIDGLYAWASMARQASDGKVQVTPDGNSCRLQWRNESQKLDLLVGF